MKHPGLRGVSQEGSQGSKSMSMGEWGRRDWMRVGFAIQGGCFAGHRTSRQWKDCWKMGGGGQGTRSPEMRLVLKAQERKPASQLLGQKPSESGRVKGIDSPNRSCRKTGDPKHEPSPTAEISVAPVEGRLCSGGHRKAAPDGGSQAGRYGAHRYVPAQLAPAQAWVGRALLASRTHPGGWWGRKAPAR